MQIRFSGTLSSIRLSSTNVCLQPLHHKLIVPYAQISAVECCKNVNFTYDSQRPTHEFDSPRAPQSNDEEVCLMLHQSHLQLDGLRLAYLEQGSPSPDTPSLVLLHGLMGSAATFVPLMQALGAHRHVIALDLPGSGLSERRPDIDPGLPATALSVTRFLATLQLQRPIILGHSHGGAVASYLAATQPDALRSLILFAPAHPYFQHADPLIRFYRTLPGRLFAYSMPWYPQWLQMMGLRRMAGPQSWDTPARLKPYRDNLRTSGTIAHLLRLVAGWDRDMNALRSLLRTPLATPVKLVWGDCDRAVPFQSANELRRHLLVSEFQILAGVGHRPAEEQPELAAALIHEWIARIGPTNAEEPFTPRDYVPAASSPNSRPIHDRMAALIPSSFGFGDSAVPAKK
jgi:pimeloyl-ACP methyl ester carboxylesterase